MPNTLSLINKMFTLGRFSKITELAQILWVLFFHCKQKMGWATTWADLSQSHQITLVVTQARLGKSKFYVCIL
jgi:hypothetical protein